MIAELAAYTMREPCKWCLKDGFTHTEGYVKSSGGQDVVRCSRCGRQCYNAPKTETGKAVRHIRSRVDLKPGQRERILERDNGFCLMCGRSASQGSIMHIGHMFSVADCIADGYGPEVYNDDDNLYSSCEECNLEQGARSLAPQVVCRLIAARIMRRKNGWGT